MKKKSNINAPILTNAGNVNIKVSISFYSSTIFLINLSNLATLKTLKTLITFRINLFNVLKGQTLKYYYLILKKSKLNQQLKLK
jgi:hypothetical protein